MDCQAIKRDGLLERYLADGLRPDVQDELETHLLECGDCVREVELLVLTRSELARRASEIRSKTAEKNWMFRWQALAFASVVMALMGVGYLSYRSRMQAKLSGGEPPLTAQATNQSSASASDPGLQSCPENMQREEITETENGETRKVAVCIDPARRQIDNLPVVVVKKPRIVIPPPVPEKQLSGARVDPNQTVLPEPGPLENPTMAKGQNPPALNASDTGGLTTEQGAELYKLGQVVAPSFTFSGFSDRVMAAGQGASSSHSRHGGSGVDTERKVFREAMTAYIGGDYRTAGELLEDAARKEPKAGDIQFYLGVCRMLNGQAQNAIEPLQRARGTNVARLQQSAHYYLAKAYMQNMMLEQAEAELRLAAGMPGPLKADAGGLLTRLRALRAEIGSRSGSGMSQ